MVSEPSSPLTGLVLRIDAKLCHVEVGGRTLTLPLRGRLFENDRGATRPIAVGDRVQVTVDGDGGAIDAVLPRSSKLARGAGGDDPRERVLAANVSLVLAVATVTAPKLDPELLDRILAGAAREGIEAAVVFTKSDLDSDGGAETWAALYRGLGYQTFLVTTRGERQADDALHALERLLAQHVTVVCGASGVGKSSLLNALAPGMNLAVGSLGKSTRGKHTTTHTQLLPLPGGGHILDTPGIRSFVVPGVPRSGVAALFREMEQLLGGCSYRDCSHLVEPGCAVRRALAEGRIAESRFASYVAILTSLTD